MESNNWLDDDFNLQDFIEKMDLKVIRIDGDKKQGYSVLIQDISSGFSAWIDCFISSGDCDVFIAFSELASNYLIKCNKLDYNSKKDAFYFK